MGIREGRHSAPRPSFGDVRGPRSPRRPPGLGRRPRRVGGALRDGGRRSKGFGAPQAHGDESGGEIGGPGGGLWRSFHLRAPEGKRSPSRKWSSPGRPAFASAETPPSIPSFEARLPGLEPVRLAGRFGLNPWRVYPGKTRERGAAGTGAPRSPGPISAPGIEPWDAGGTVDLSLEANGAGLAKAPVRLRADIGLANGKFNDPGFTVASDALTSRVHLEGEYIPGGRVIEGRATVELVHGESLWKRFYISWDKSPLKAEFSGRYDPAARSLEAVSARIVVPGLGELRAGGRLDFKAPLTFSFHANSELSLEPALAMLSPAQSPSQGGARVSGNAAGDVEIRKTADGLALKGRLTLADVSVVNPSTGFSIPNLSAELPLDLAFAAPPAPRDTGAAGESGALRLGDVRTAHLAFHVPPLSVSSLPNALAVAPFSLEIFGGRLEFGATSLAVNTKPLSLRGASSVKLTEIDLSGLPFVPAGSALEGKIRADFPSLEITQARISASGRAEVDAFGGRVVITGLAVADPFAPDRKISCDAEILDLDLKKITDLVAFGEVTGVIRGEVRDLVIAYGQPEKFTLTIESVKKKGVPRTFSLKAVNSLTVITAGQQATPGTGSFWLRFIKGFRYDRIGIRSTLKNDTFTIDGTIVENGVEYLVKRPPLFGISVINRNPGKTIGFKDMMSRLKRVGPAGAPATQ